MTLAELTQTRAWSDPRNRERVAEAAGLPVVPRINGTTEPPNHETTGDGWLHRLMQCPSWAGRRLDTEEELSLWVAAELRRLTRSGALRAVWTRCPVEVRAGGRLAAMWQCLGRVLGVVPGAPDFWLCWGAGSGLIELKIEARQGDLIAQTKRRTYLRQNQRDFREWAVSLGVKHAVARSVPEVLATLREWGRL